jgi:hypothetical protein
MDASLCEATLDLDDAIILGEIRARDAMGKGRGTVVTKFAAGRVEVTRKRASELFYDEIPMSDLERLQRAGRSLHRLSLGPCRPPITVTLGASVPQLKIGASSGLPKLTSDAKPFE